MMLYSTNVVYVLNPTSNHNVLDQLWPRHLVVYVLNPTSNHNGDAILIAPWKLYMS